MKNVRFFYFAGMLFLIYSCNNQNTVKNNTTINTQLQDLLEQKRYFKLRSQLESYNESISNKQRLYFQAFVDNAFNRNERSIKEADTLLQKYSSELSDSTIAILYLLQDDCYFKMFQYKKSAQLESVVLDHYSAKLDSEKINDLKNSHILHKAIENLPPQQTIIPDSTVIHWKADKVGLMEIPVKFNEKTADGIFDTRANISTISQTYAIKLGLRRLNVSYEEGSGITGLKFQTSVGIADSLYIGSILVRNAIFQIMPDSILHIAPINFSMNLIIGYPIIEQLKEIQIYKDGRMIIPLKQSKSKLHNFALDGLDPVIELKTEHDTLPFYFDSGAGNSALYFAYFKRYKSQVLSKGLLKTIKFGGAGGVKKDNVYVLPSFNLYLDNKRATLDSVSVLTHKIGTTEKLYGNIGRDFMSQFDELILNFKTMYVDVR